MKKTDANLPKISGYTTPVVLSYNVLFLNILSFVVFIGSIFGFNLLRIFIETGSFKTSLSGNIDIIWLFLITLIFVVTILCHEAIHGIFFALLKYKVSFGAVLPVGVYTMARNQFIKRKHYLIIAIAPLLLINTICIALLFLKIPAISDVAIWALILNTSGAVGDMWLFYTIKKSPKNTLFYDTSPFQNYIYYPEVENKNT